MPPNLDLFLEKLIAGLVLEYFPGFLLEVCWGFMILLLCMAFYLQLQYTLAVCFLRFTIIGFQLIIYF